MYQESAINLQHSSTIDLDALLSILIDYEKEYTDLKVNGGEYSVLPIVNWFMCETIDNIDTKSIFFITLKDYVTSLANDLIEELSEYKLKNNHGSIRYHYEGRTYGGYLRLKQTIDILRSEPFK